MTTADEHLNHLKSFLVSCQFEVLRITDDLHLKLGMTNFFMSRTSLAHQLAKVNKG